LVRWQVTGGSLKESREALEIAETDGKPWFSDGAYPWMCLLGACKMFDVMHLRSSLLSVECREAVLHRGCPSDKMRGNSILLDDIYCLLSDWFWDCYICICALVM
jgi:hypothetical protein